MTVVGRVLGGVGVGVAGWVACQYTQIAKFMGPTWAHLSPIGPRWAREHHIFFYGIPIPGKMVFISNQDCAILIWCHLLAVIGMSIYPNSKVYGANMGPTWVLSAPDGLVNITSFLWNPHSGKDGLYIEPGLCYFNMMSFIGCHNPSVP